LLEIMEALLDIIIISFNTRDLTLRCIASVMETCTLPHTITVVDNNSSDGTVKAIKARYTDVNIIERTTNGGYAAAVNTGMAATSSEICLITNADTRYFPKAIDELYNFMSVVPNAGTAGLQQVYPDGSWQRSHGYYPGIKFGIYDILGINKFINYRNAKAFNANKNQFVPKETEYIDGAILMTRRTAFDEVGGFDEAFFFYAEETDYCFRLRKKGWKNMLCPWIRSEHIRGASSNAFPHKESVQLLVDGKIIFLKKHYGKFVLTFFTIMEFIHFFSTEAIAKTARLFMPDTQFWNRKQELYAKFLTAWKKNLYL